MSNPVDSEVMGHYGDFIGGAIGTFITLILLYVTLTLQRKTFESQEKVSTKNIEMLAIQQLNDKFFKLYDVYKDIVGNLSVVNGQTVLNGKSALSCDYTQLYNNFNSPPVVGVRRKAAVLDYIKFYASHKDFAPIYFRTLYHMFEEIERAEDVNIAERQKYVRLLRSQFTETELIFIRYNAMTPMGANSIKYVNKYNLMKHLPPMELMEYKEWKTHHQMSDLQVNGISTILLALKTNMIYALSGEKPKNIESSDERYVLDVETSDAFSSLKITMYRDSSKKLYPNDIQFEGFEGFSANDLKDFLLYFVKDCIVLLNFNKFNVRRELTFMPQTNNQGQKEEISVSVANREKRRIAINNKQYEDLLAASSQESSSGG